MNNQEEEKRRIRAELQQILAINAWIQSDKRPVLLIENKPVFSVALDRTWAWTTEDHGIEDAHEPLDATELQDLFRQTYTPIITHVFLFPNRMTVVTDQHGLQMPEFQGPLEKVKPKIDAIFTGTWEGNKTIRSLILGVDPTYLNNEEGVAASRKLDDGRVLEVQSQTFGQGQLSIRKYDSLIYDNQWQYRHVRDAMKALEEWNPLEEEEPKGWTRHFDTQRYRIQGKPGLEFIKGEGKFPNDVIAAIHITCGPERAIDDIIEHPDRVGASFPVETRMFEVISHQTVCHRIPVCTTNCSWHDVVWQYLDRFVVVKFNELPFTSIGTILRRLTEKVG